MTAAPVSIAVFITPHGYGHAARAAAVMDALHRCDQRVVFEVFTTVPAWFFQQSCRAPFRMHPVTTDVGMVQRDPFHEDPAATLARLDHFLPFAPALVTDLAATLRRLDCRLVLCDIAPLGIAVARHAGVPSVLVENFTWDWVYRPYVRAHPGFARHIAGLRDWFRQADLHVQTEPVCRRMPACPVTGPVSRLPRTGRADTRRRLGIPPDRRVVVISGGGIPWQPPVDDPAGALPADVHLVLFGAAPNSRFPDGITGLPHHSAHYHPDVLSAADAVIGKVGYSTLAEVYRAGIPFGYIARPGFIESRPLVRFIRRHMPARPFRVADFTDGTWVARTVDLLRQPPRPPALPDGAEGVAASVHAFLQR